MESVCNQSLKDIEIILINDGSSDNSFEICREFADRDKRIKLLSIDNSGSAVARNLGLEKARGEYIGFVDSDDFIDQSMFSKLYKKAIEFQSDIVGCNFQKRFVDKTVKNEYFFEEGFYSKKDIEKYIYPEIICADNFSAGFPRTMVTKLFSSNLVKQFNIKFIPELKVSQDVVFTTNCMLFCNSFYHLDKEYLYTYRQSNHSRTNRYLENSWSIFKKNISSYKEMVSNINGYDFKNQIGLATIRSAMTAISYEGKVTSNTSPIRRIKNIKQILNDEDLIKALKITRVGKVTLFRRLLIILMRHKQILICYLLTIINNTINKSNKYS